MLEIYREGDAGQSYVECQRLSKCIMDKWYRDKYSIETTYDAAGKFDDGWKKLQGQLNKEHKRQRVDDVRSVEIGHFLSSKES